MSMENKIGWLTEIADKGAKGSVKFANGDSAQVEATEVKPVPPQKKDQCVFVGSDLIGTRGSMLGFEVDEAIIADSSGQWHMAAVRNICKLHAA